MQNVLVSFVYFLLLLKGGGLGFAVGYCVGGVINIIDYGCNVLGRVKDHLAFLALVIASLTYLWRLHSFSTSSCLVTLDACYLAV